MKKETLNIKIGLHKLFLESGGKEGKRLSLLGANLSWANLSRANLSNTNLSNTNLSNADLSWADLSWTDLSNADLSNADLSWTDLSNADLSNADLSWTDLSWADLSWADLSGSKWDGIHFPETEDNRITNYYKKLIFCGCFRGSLEKFEERVNSKEDNCPRKKAYLQIILEIKNHKNF